MRTSRPLVQVLAVLATSLIGLNLAPAQEAEPTEEPSEDAPRPKKKPARAEEEPSDAESEDEEMKGEVGEACRKRSDCEKGLKCVAGTCTNPLEGADCESRADCGGKLKCLRNVCTSAKPKPAQRQPTWDAPSTESSEPSKRDGEAEAPKPFSGTNGFVGFLFAGGPSVANDNAAGGILFAIKAGALFDRVELGVELSPVTYLPDFDADPTLLMQAYLGYHIEMTPTVSWPIRAGAGMAAINVGDNVLFQGRLDLVGVSVAAAPVLVDLYMPSFRIIPGEGGVLLSWMFGAGISLVP